MKNNDSLKVKIDDAIHDYQTEVRLSHRELLRIQEALDVVDKIPTVKDRISEVLANIDDKSDAQSMVMKIFKKYFPTSVLFADMRPDVSKDLYQLSNQDTLI